MAPREFDAQCESIARIIAAEYFLPGNDHDDTIQEARIGVWKAIRDFRPAAGRSFAPFARLCATRQVITALKGAQRAKHMALNEAVRFEAQVLGYDAPTLGDTIPAHGADPHDQLMAREDARTALHNITLLSPLERNAAEQVLIQGRSYHEAENAKQVDNALQRVRRRLADMPDPQPDQRSVVYVDRLLHPDEDSAITAALDVREGQIVKVTACRLLDGHEQAPQGRPRADGRRGQLVWRIDFAVDGIIRAKRPIDSQPHRATRDRIGLVADLLAQGLGATQIANRLGYSLRSAYYDIERATSLKQAA